MKNSLLAFAVLLAATILQPRAYASCLPSTVTVYDENLQPVQVDPYILERNSLFKGRLTVDEKGVASFSASSSDGINPCWNDAPTSLLPMDKSVTTSINTPVNINVLLDENKEDNDAVELVGLVNEPVYGKANVKKRKMRIRYKPNKDWCGVDSFDYEVSDGQQTITERVTVNVQCTVAEQPIDEQTPLAGSNQARYDAKVFDVDGDGLNDVFVVTNYASRIKDFYLRQLPGSKFQLVTNPTATQIHFANFYPTTDIAVIREDYNADGMLDMLVTNIEEYIWGASEYLIIAKKRDTTKLGKLIEINDKFRAVRNGIEAINNQTPGNTSFWTDLYNNKISYCAIIYLPFYYWTFENGWQIYWVPVRICMSGNEYLRRYLKHSEHYDYIGSMARMDSRYGLNGFQAPAGGWYDSAMAKIMPQLDQRQILRTARTVRNGVQIWRTGSVAATAILIADDATVVGVLDDVALIATVTSIGVSFIALEVLDYYIAEMEANVDNDDVGEESQGSTGAGTFTIPGHCDPKKPGQIMAPDSESGTSGNLNKNLKSTGCWCEGADVTGAAHHIIPKKAGDEIGEELRQCLVNKRGINIDSAVNGVCLPTKKTEQSDAIRHSGNEGKLHGKARLKELLDLCNDNSMSNDEFADLLRDIAEGYTKGIVLP